MSAISGNGSTVPKSVVPAVATIASGGDVAGLTNRGLECLRDHPVMCVDLHRDDRGFPPEAQCGTGTMHGEVGDTGTEDHRAMQCADAVLPDVDPAPGGSVIAGDHERQQIRDGAAPG